MEGQSRGSDEAFSKVVAMDLRLCLKEGARPLEDRFECFASRERERGQPHLRELILALREPPFDRTVYALSSMDRLCLLSQNYWDTPWWVRVSCRPGGFRVSAYIPTDLEPWNGAEYVGTENDPGLAAHFVVQALEATRGWDTEGYAVPGLSEIIEQQLAGILSTEADAARQCREFLTPGERLRSVIWSTAGHHSEAGVVARTSESQVLVYHTEGGYTYGRWGLARLDEGRLVATRDEDWYRSLVEAFCSSEAFVGELPGGLYQHRDVAGWRARPDLKRFPPELPD